MNKSLIYKGIDLRELIPELIIKYIIEDLKKDEYFGDFIKDDESGFEVFKEEFLDETSGYSIIETCNRLILAAHKGALNIVEE